MEAVAKTKYLKGSPRKARLVVDMIRGVNVSRALSILKFTDKRAAEPIAKCLNSAIANATFKAEQQNIAIDPDDLWVKTIFVDMGPHKHRSRMRPAPQGRAYREQRHYCHITIEVTSEERAKSEDMFRLDEARAARIAAKKEANEKAKAAKVYTKVAAPEVEEVETPIVETAAETVEAPVETVEAAPVEENNGEAIVDETPAEIVEEAAAKVDAEQAAAHETSTHTTAEENAHKPADEVMEKTNEDLERQ
ncbi:MAG: 50S ribosomal protein L22 [Pyrinomonadaceae bacterium]|nr:50S ribosomal protein L22 [Acidobacteriota bacterium]MBK7934787.1 50S ribosomal protein L22 [Acidobacteriota bacterium]MBP7376874.1 50S ribosomal protein L22 [Pyrinomonadaceae bacterium]